MYEVAVVMSTTSTVSAAPMEENEIKGYKTGEAPLKKEYLKPLSEAPASIHASTREANDAPKEKMKGTFKKRPVDLAEDPMITLCRAVANGKGCPFGDSCKFTHDIKDFMKRKEKDLGEKCPLFEAFGFCEYGLNCRFSTQHIKEVDGEWLNVIPENLEEAIDQQKKNETNDLSHDVRTMLRKNIYPFKSMEQNFKGKRNKKAKQKQSTATEVDEHSKSTETPAQNIKEEYVEPVKESPLLPEQKKIDFKRKVYVAPLTTVGNLPFRRLMKQTGADITCGEMAMATNLLKAQQSEWALLRRHKSEDCFGVQIAGGFPDQMSRVCELITRETDVDFIDINMGCPIDLVCQQGAGAALMNRPPRIMEVVSSSLTGIELGASAVAQIGRVTPGLTVKLRTGWSEKQPTAHKLIRKIQGIRASSVYMNASVVQDYRLRATQYVDAVTIHGRSRLQRYTRNADWDYVFQCADEQDPEQPQIPFIGGGDVLSFEEFDEHLKNGKLETCMIARGALIKPWLPIEIKERRHFDISASERFDLLKDFVRFGLEHWGSDQKGINRTRRYLLEWQSFLCRYIPVGLLERLPQRINDRPAPYYGRNDLETLMASDQAVDWVKLSELLLGPVPEGFQFVPKHKANAYVTTTSSELVPHID